MQDFLGTLSVVQKVLPLNSFHVANPSNSTFASVLLQENMVYNSVSKTDFFCKLVTVDKNPHAI